MGITTAVRERILELCQERKITINKLGTICGITQSTLKNVVAERNGLTVITLKKICDGLDMSIVEFFDTEAFCALEQEIE